MIFRVVISIIAVMLLLEQIVNKITSIILITTLNIINKFTVDSVYNFHKCKSFISKQQNRIHINLIECKIITDQKGDHKIQVEIHPKLKYEIPLYTCEFKPDEYKPAKVVNYIPSKELIDSIKTKHYENHLENHLEFKD
jgi:hypothetical protein